MNQLADQTASETLPTDHGELPRWDVAGPARAAAVQRCATCSR